jgi:hypothetical protein
MVMTSKRVFMKMFIFCCMILEQNFIACADQQIIRVQGDYSIIEMRAILDQSGIDRLRRWGMRNIRVEERGNEEFLVTWEDVRPRAPGNFN